MVKQLRSAGAADIPALKRLWKTCFGDEDAYIAFYFQNGYPSSRTLVLTADGVPVSMLTLMPVTLRTCSGTVQGEYVYAVATDPAGRGHGLMRELMEYAEAQSRQQKRAFLTLVPANPSLFQLYGKLGYTVCTTLGSVEISPAAPVSKAVKVTEVGKETYFEQRREWLAGMPGSLVFSDESYLMAEMRCTGCKTVLIQASETGFACFYTEEETLVIRETSLAAETLNDVANTLCRCYGCSSWKAKLANGDVPYAMIKPLDSTVPLSSCYMNLMLD